MVVFITPAGAQNRANDMLDLLKEVESICGNVLPGVEERVTTIVSEFFHEFTTDEELWKDPCKRCVNALDRYEQQIKMWHRKLQLYQRICDKEPDVLKGLVRYRKQLPTYRCRGKLVGGETVFRYHPSDVIGRCDTVPNGWDILEHQLSHR